MTTVRGVPRALLAASALVIGATVLLGAPVARAQVPGDVCDTAVAIDLGVTVSFDTSIASNEGNAASCFYTPAIGVIDLWYSVTVAADGEHMATTCSAGVDTQVAIFSGDCATELACSDADCPVFATEVHFDALAGETYTIQVSGWGLATVASELTVWEVAQLPPANDTCAGALPLAGSAAFGTASATTSGVTSSCGGEHDVWFTAEVPCDAQVTLRTCGSDFDTTIAVWTDACPAPGDPAVACDDDATGGPCAGTPQSQLSFPATAGQTVYVQVAGAGGATGVGVLEMEVAPAHDDCAGALPLSPGVEPWTSACGSDGAIDPGCGAAAGGDDLWYSYEVPGTGLLAVEASAVDPAAPTVALFDGLAGCPAPGDSPLACAAGVPGGAAALEIPVNAGQHILVQVSADAGGGPDPTGTVSLAFTATVDLTGEHVVVIGEDPGPIDSVTGIVLALANNGVTPVVVEDVTSIAGAPAAVYYMGGSWPLNQPLSPAEGALLAALVQEGTGAYVTGGDIWGFDPATDFWLVDGVDESASSDGDEACAEQTGADLFVGIGGPYSPEPGGWIDHLAPAAPGQDVLGDDVAATLSCGGEIKAVRYATTPGAGRVVSQSTEFGGLPADQRTALCARLLTFFATGEIPQGFVRGDANADGTVEISDVIFLLGALFIPGSPQPTCTDAADANDSGAIDIADALYLLEELFLSGDPPPAPFPDCGLDPIASLGCDAFAPCP